MTMMPNCVRCNCAGYARIEIKVTIGRTTLAVDPQAEQRAVCAQCMLELAKWFKIGDEAVVAAELAPGKQQQPLDDSL